MAASSGTAPRNNYGSDLPAYPGIPAAVPGQARRVRGLLSDVDEMQQGPYPRQSDGASSSTDLQVPIHLGLRQHSVGPSAVVDLQEGNRPEFLALSLAACAAGVAAFICLARGIKPGTSSRVLGTACWLAPALGVQYFRSSDKGFRPAAIDLALAVEMIAIGTATKFHPLTQSLSSQALSDAKIFMWLSVAGTCWQALKKLPCFQSTRSADAHPLTPHGDGSDAGAQGFTQAAAQVRRGDIP